MAEKGSKTYLVGDFIFREGEQGNIAYVVESGVVELVKLKVQFAREPNIPPALFFVIVPVVKQLVNIPL